VNTLETLKKNLKQIVTDVQGCKETELALKLVEAHQAAGFPLPEPDLVFKALDELVAEKELVRVSYVLFELNYREKSFYLPSSTRIILS
jgi:hypothetical protein